VVKIFALSQVIQQELQLTYFCVSHQIVNRVQKLRKKAGLEPTDTVEVYYDVLDGVVGSDSSVLQQVFTGQVQSHVY
jgi:ABC-type transporter Mla maintaining outer membrane lipid asymmetry ATPase subunit MlaF